MAECTVFLEKHFSQSGTRLENGLFGKIRWGFNECIALFNCFVTNCLFIEDTDNAEIIWKFNLSNTNLKVKYYKLIFETKTFGDGKIDVSVTTSDGRTNIEDAKEFQIVAKLSGGKGDVAWQHTQLFRQSLNAREYPFELQVELH